jgi:protein arginine kinase activator
MTLTCTRCGTTDTELGAPGGRMGCASCYDTFRDELLRTFERRSGVASHLGLRPSTESDCDARQSDLARLNALLERAVEREDFEDAARYRDQIADLTRWISEEDEA